MSAMIPSQKSGAVATGATRAAGLTGLAMLAFAANSILTRLALAGGEIDAAGFSGVRLLAGAAVLALLVYGPASRRPPSTPLAIGGDWLAAACLLGYVVAFSFAYLRLGAGIGALVLFGSVQIGMIGWAMLKGERHGVGEWLGFALALAGFAYLTSPGVAAADQVAPDLVGAVAMVAAGLCWAAYSLIGRGSAAPLVDTAGNFLRCAPIAFALAAAGLATQRATPFGLACAAASGALASGLGYAVWYAALPLLSRARAAIVQLTVPPLAALGGVAVIAEPLTLRLVAASVVILGGVALTIRAADRRRSA